MEWNNIKLAEQSIDEGEEEYSKLMELYRSEYSNATLGIDYIVG